MINVNNPNKLLELKDYYHEYDPNYHFFDSKVLKTGEVCMIGRPYNGTGIVVNIFEKDSETPEVSYLQEISEYKCKYPYVFYCKGNTEIFIHCIYHPDKVYKYELENDVFLCWLDFSSSFYTSSMYLKDNQFIAFLSLRKGKYFVNVISYDHFSSPGEFTVYSSQ